VQVGLTINPDLTVLLKAPTVETGSGASSVAVYACAEALDFLGITPDDIHWTSVVDTDTSLKDTVQADSAVALLLAELIADAAEKVKERIDYCPRPWTWECNNLISRKKFWTSKHRMCFYYVRRV